MKNFSDVYKTLRRKNMKQYGLLSGCCFFSVLLITAYVCMMRSPTVLNVLPEGGDSRKQVMMIFVLAVIGCGVFTIYAASLFFRSKSRETGIFMALGAGRGQLRSRLMAELAFISLCSCGAGALLGRPLAAAIWQIFRAFVVDTEQMALSFDPEAYLISLAFSVFVTAALFIMGWRSVSKTNIIDTVQESRKSEPVREIPGWFGWAGILLLAAGGFLGYIVPSFCVIVLHWYAPGAVTAIFYLPALAGLYMILLHTVVNGWRRKKHRYKDIIATSMMKFQGRQTVNNMLVMCLLIAGAYFASFYTPMLGVGALMGYERRPVDYMYFYREDQDIPGEAEVRSLAEDYGVNITSWTQVPMIRLGIDGTYSIEKEGPMGTTWERAYSELLMSEMFMSESSYRKLTGENVELESGCIAGVMDDYGDNGNTFPGNAKILTNYLSGERLYVNPDSTLCSDMLFGRYVMDDGDYEKISQGLSDEWRQTMVFFNVENCDESYDFAKALFNLIVDRSGPEVEVYDSWDPVMRQHDIEETGSYYMDKYHVYYDQRDSSEFRLYWQYMPLFRVLDKADFVRTTAVYLMLFIFISIVCFAAVFVIAFTRCMTIALNNRQVYEDMRKLGAPNAYLFSSVRGQVSKVFFVPAFAGTGLIYAFYFMIMFFNDNRLTNQELAGMLACLLLVAAISLLMYLVYRLTLKKVCTALNIKKKQGANQK